MKKYSLHYHIFALVGCLVLGYWLTLASCSNSVAGGTGVGNPDGKTIVSLVADTGFVSTEKNHLYSQSEERYKTQNNPYNVVPIIDKDSLILLVDSALLVVDKITFMLANNNESCKVDGPFIFNALTGNSIPSLDSVILPPGKYSGLKLHIHNKDGKVLEGYTIVLQGKFTYKNKNRKFSIKLNHNINPNYKYLGPAVTVSENDTTTFLLVLNADMWLQNIPLKQYLDDGSITFDVNGDLKIDDSTESNPFNDFKNTMRNNIVESGILFITKNQ